MFEQHGERVQIDLYPVCAIRHKESLFYFLGSCLKFRNMMWLYYKLHHNVAYNKASWCSFIISYIMKLLKKERKSSKFLINIYRSSCSVYFKHVARVEIIRRNSILSLIHGNKLLFPGLKIFFFFTFFFYQLLFFQQNLY